MRRSRKRSIPVSSFIRPILIYDFGDEEKDPCFGKLYDLTEVECQACGDKEFCAIVTSQKAKSRRIELEKEEGSLDKEMNKAELHLDIKDYVEDLIASGKSRMLAIQRASKKFHVNRSKIKSLL